MKRIGYPYAGVYHPPFRFICPRATFIGPIGPFNFIDRRRDAYWTEYGTFVQSSVMKTIIVDVPEKDAVLFNALLQRLGLRSRPMTDEDLEEQAMAKWIGEGLRTEEVPTEEVLKALRKGGVTV